MMNLRDTFRAATLGLGLLAAALIADASLSLGWVIQDAQARLGRPMTPVSVAGVARRTTRRTIYATGVYAATLPRGCTTVIIEGSTLQQCGATYYQPSGTQYVVVTVD